MLLDLNLDDLHVITDGLIDHKYYVENFASDDLLVLRLERIIDHLQRVLDQETK